MQTIFDFFWNLGTWNWFILALLMIVLETVIPGVHFMWFGMAAIVLGAVLVAYPMPFAVQIVAFGALSLAMIVAVRRIWRPETITSDEPDLNERGRQYVGRVVTVEDAIAGGRGKVRVGDTLWQAEGPDTPEGAKVKVTGTKGTVLVVEHAAA